ncbi:MAG: hypothetical protein J6M17_02775 [Ruminococcus sp.]|nr:hypothetical protein [Ruminococcus sp.]
MSKYSSMNSVRPPDLDNLSADQKNAINSGDQSRRMTGGFNTSGDFSSASKKHHDLQIKPNENELLPSDGAKLNEEFTSTRRSKDPKIVHNDEVRVKRTKVRSKKRRSRTLTLVVFAAVALFIFSPPIFKADATQSGCRYEDLFASAGVTQYKAEVIDQHYVYNIDAMNSDRSSSYRICTVAFEISNPGPFEISVEDMIIFKGGEGSDHIVYTGLTEPVHRIPAFGKKTVTADILINKDGLDDAQFDKAITSLVLTTKGMKKDFFGLKFPSIPGFMKVASEITFDKDAV